MIVFLRENMEIYEPRDEEVISTTRLHDAIPDARLRVPKSFTRIIPSLYTHSTQYTHAHGFLQTTAHQEKENKDVNRRETSSSRKGETELSINDI